MSDVNAQMTKAAEWDATRAEAEAELAALEARAGRDVLDNPDAIGELSSRIAALRARVTLAGSAAHEARQRAQDARAAELLGEAEALLPPLAKARKALQAYESRRDELLTALREHTGEQWWVAPDHSAIGATRPTPPGVKLAEAVGLLERQRAALLADAERVATDPEYVTSAEQERRRHRADWERVVSEYRGWASALEQLPDRIEAQAAAVGFDLTSDDNPAWLRDLRAEADDLRGKLAMFPHDVELIGGLLAAVGDPLDEDGVGELLKEFGLADAEQPVGAEAS